MAAVKALPPNISIFWVDDGDQTTLGYEGVYGEGIVNVDAPTAAEINAGLNITCALTTDLTLGWTERDTDDTRGLCDDSNVANPTAKNYEGQLNIFVDQDPNKVDESIYNDVMRLFKKPLRQGYLVQRISKHPVRNPNIVDGDWVTVFKFLSGDPNVITDASAPLQLQPTFYPQGVSSDGLVQVGALAS
jgi:hypothetical protein